MRGRRTTTPALVEEIQRAARPLTKTERQQLAGLVDKLDADLREAARYASWWDCTTIGVGRWDGLEKAIIIVRAERGRCPGLTFTDAVRAVVAVGLSRRTAARAWRVCKVPG